MFGWILNTNLYIASVFTIWRLLKIIENLFKLPENLFTLFLIYWALYNNDSITAQKLKFSIKDFLSKCDQIRRKLRIWSYSLKEFWIEN